MKPQNYVLINQEIEKKFIQEKKRRPERFKRRLSLSWSIWMFGTEPIEDSLERLQRNGLEYVEIKGDTSIPKERMKQALESYGIRVSGACGMFSPERDLSSTSSDSQENAIDYVRRVSRYVADLYGVYMIIVPGAVGRPEPVDNLEIERSAEALKRCVRFFENTGVKPAIEPIRAAEVSLVHTVEEALKYLEKVNEPSINSLNGDIYHMLNGERNVGEAILKCGERLVNLHIADSNRDAPGKGQIDIDTAIMAAYLTGMNKEGRFITFEPLGPYPDPYVLSTSPCNVEVMDRLVKDSVEYFREREEIVRSL
jgi:sugar phosphate isomerase/epimerase